MVLKLYHGWEYSIIGFLVLGFIYDHRPNLWAYSISYRARFQFDARKIEPGKQVRQSYVDFPDKLPLKSLWEPWYRRKIEPWFAERVTITLEVGDAKSNR